MEAITLYDINFNNLQKLNSQGNTSTIYHDKTTCYKILNGLFPEERRDLNYKIILMNDIKIDNVIFPEKLIFDNDYKFIGYTTEYIPHTLNLSEKFQDKFVVSIKDFFTTMSASSEILRNIHRERILYQDLSFENIIIDKKNNPYFIDLDGCSYDGFSTRFISGLVGQFYLQYKEQLINQNYDLDKLSMLLPFLFTIFNKPIQEVSKYDYDKMSEKLNTLNNLREYVENILDKDEEIYDLPYLDDVIDKKDKMIIKRKILKP